MLDQSVGRLLSSDSEHLASKTLTDTPQRHADASGGLPTTVLLAAVLLLTTTAFTAWPMLQSERAGSKAERNRGTAPIRALLGALTTSDDELLALTSEGRLQAFSLRTGLPLPRADDPQSGVVAMDQTPDGQTRALGFIDGTLRIDWDGSGKHRSLTKDCGSAVESVLLSSDGERLIADTISGPPRLYDSRTGGVRIEFARNVAEILAISPDDALLAAIGSDNSELRLLSLRDGALVGRCIALEPIRKVCFSPCGSTIIVGSTEGSISCRAVATLEELWAAAASRRSSPHYPCSAIAVAGQVVAVERGIGCLCLFDLRTGALLASRDGHIDGIANLFFSNDGQRLTCISRDGSVCTRSVDSLADLWHTELIDVGRIGQWSEPE